MAYFLRLLNLHCTCPNNGDKDAISLSINGVQVKQLGNMSYDDQFTFQNTPLIPIKKDLNIVFQAKEWLKPRIELGSLKVNKHHTKQLTLEAWFGRKENNYRLLYEIIFERSVPILHLQKLESIQSVGIWGWDKISLIVNSKLALNNRKVKQGQTAMLNKKYKIGKQNNIRISLVRHETLKKEQIGQINLNPSYKSIGVHEEVFDNYGCLYELKYEIVQFVL